MEKLIKVTSSGKYAHIFTEITNGERKILKEQHLLIPDRYLVIIYSGYQGDCGFALADHEADTRLFQHLVIFTALNSARF